MKSMKEKGLQAIHFPREFGLVFSRRLTYQQSTKDVTSTKKSITNPIERTDRG